MLQFQQYCCWVPILDDATDRCRCLGTKLKLVPAFWRISAVQADHSGFTPWPWPLNLFRIGLEAIGAYHGTLAPCLLFQQRVQSGFD